MHGWYAAWHCLSVHSHLDDMQRDTASVYTHTWMICSVTQPQCTLTPGWYTEWHCLSVHSNLDDMQRLLSYQSCITSFNNILYDDMHRCNKRVDISNRLDLNSDMTVKDFQVCCFSANALNNQCFIDPIPTVLHCWCCPVFGEFFKRNLSSTGEVQEQRRWQSSHRFGLGGSIELQVSIESGFHFEDGCNTSTKYLHNNKILPIGTSAFPLDQNHPSLSSI